MLADTASKCRVGNLSAASFATVWVILIVVQVLDVDYMAYGSGSVYQRCAEQVLHVSTMVPNCVPKHT